MNKPALEDERVPVHGGRPYYYKLVDDTPVPITYYRELRDAEKERQRTHIKTRVLWMRVSTVFLCIDHSFMDDGPPVLWETMIFGRPLDQLQWRYTSAMEARRGHKRAVQIALFWPITGPWNWIESKISSWRWRRQYKRRQRERPAK